MMDIEIIPILKDNYAYLLKTSDGVTAIVDPGEADPIIDVLEAQGLKLDYILNTHHHWDHVNGNPKLKATYGATLVAPEKDAHQIKDVDETLKEDDVFTLGNETAKIIETPGHTMGHICYYFEDAKALFTGDTVFSMSCGRLFEGTPADMFSSFQKLKALPDDVMMYCGHEYTRANAGFCLAHDKNNEDLKKRIAEVKALREKDMPTLPVALGVEKKTNIFMKAQSADEFAELRTAKDNF